MKSLPADLAPGEIYFLQGSLNEGWTLKEETGQPLHLLTDSEIFGWSRPRPRIRPRKSASAPETAYADLQVGDYVVHVDYGIGLFQGLVEKNVDGIQREYLQLEFDDTAHVLSPFTRQTGSPATLVQMETS